MHVFIVRYKLNISIRNKVRKTVDEIMSIINVRIKKYLLLLWIWFCCITFGIRSIGKRTEKNGIEGIVKFVK